MPCPRPYFASISYHKYTEKLALGILNDLLILERPLTKFKTLSKGVRELTSMTRLQNRYLNLLASRGKKRTALLNKISRF